MCLTVDLHKNLVQMPLPIRIRSHPTDPVSADLCREHWTKFIPPETDSFMADVDAAFVQKILHIAKRKRETTYIITARRMISELVLT